MGSIESNHGRNGNVSSGAPSARSSFPLSGVPHPVNKHGSPMLVRASTLMVLASEDGSEEPAGERTIKSLEINVFEGSVERRLGIRRGL